MAAIHGDGFKRDAVRILQTSGLTRRQVASDLGVGQSTLAKRVRVFAEAAKVPAQDAKQKCLSVTGERHYLCLGSGGDGSIWLSSLIFCTARGG